MAPGFGPFGYRNSLWSLRSEQQLSNFTILTWTILIIAAKMSPSSNNSFQFSWQMYIAFVVHTPFMFPAWIPISFSQPLVWINLFEIVNLRLLRVQILALAVFSWYPASMIRWLMKSLARNMISNNKTMSIYFQSISAFYTKKVHSETE